MNLPCRKFAIWTLCLIVLQQFLWSPLSTAAESAQEIVAKADAIRAPDQDYLFDSTVTTYEEDKKQSQNGYTVYVGGHENALVEFTSPSSEQGKSILLHGDSLWIYLPRLKRPTRIALRQRLLGDVAIGDMARLSFSEDYNATLIGSETIDGKETYVMDLLARSDKETYSRIKYWINKADYRPMKAEFLTVSGRIIKIGYFQDFRQEAGDIRPMTMVFIDAVNPKQRSILAMKNMRTKELPERMFTKAYLKTLE